MIEHRKFEGNLPIRFHDMSISIVCGLIWAANGGVPLKVADYPKIR